MQNAWVELSEAERELLSRLLICSRLSANHNTLIAKLEAASSHPNITVGVHGGQVQWTEGNPFPIRVCDYDGNADDLPSVDERGNRCRIWFEPADGTAT
jgi:hypothetical protein